MASLLLPTPAENPAFHKLFGLVCSCVRLKILPLFLLPDQNREFFKEQVLGYLVLTGENNHE